MEKMWTKSEKNKKCDPVFFFRRGKKKTEKCASGEVGRTSHVSPKKKLYPFVITNKGTNCDDSVLLVEVVVDGRQISLECPKGLLCEEDELSDKSLSIGAVMCCW